MLQDIYKSYTCEDKILCTGFPKWISFSAAKNNLIDGLKKAKKGIDQETLRTAELDFYKCNAKLLEIAGWRIGESNE